MKINKDGLELIKKHEALRLAAYLDPVGVPTIGYGHTKGVKLGDKITKVQAEKFLKEDVGDAEGAVNNLVKVALNDNQFSALVSFVFNVGIGAFQQSTLLRFLNQKQYSEVRGQLLRWVYGTDKKTGRKIRLAGLVARREDEAKLFNSR